MKRFIMSMVLMLTMSVAQAGFSEFLPNDVSSLSEKQKAELSVQIATMKAEAKTLVNPINSIEKVKEYSELVTAIGGGVKETAKELGIAANDFVKTPVGMLTAFLISWNYIGDTILGVAVGAIWFLVMVPGWIYFYRRLALIKHVEYFDKGKRDDGKRKVVTYASEHDTKIDSGAHFALALILVAICGTGFVLIFA